MRARAHLFGVQAFALGPPLTSARIQQVQVVDEADAAVADKLLDGGDGCLLGLAVLVARTQLPAEPPATSVARQRRGRAPLAAVNLSQPSMTRRRSLESVLPRMRNILGNLSITSPGCHTHAAGSSAGQAYAGVHGPRTAGVPPAEPPGYPRLPQGPPRPPPGAR